MVIFDQLRISDDGKYMYVNAHVNEAEMFKDIYIEGITIAIADKVLETSAEIPTDNEDIVYHKSFKDTTNPNGVKSIALVLPPNNPNELWNLTEASSSKCKGSLSEDLFFVYIETTDASVNPCIPCIYDKRYTLGVTFDENMLYQRVMDYVRELASDCTIPQGFTDFILLWNAFKAAVETEHYVPAINYFKILFGQDIGDRSVSVALNDVPKSYPMGVKKGGCGCHG